MVVQLLLNSATDTINSQTTQLSTPVHLATEAASLELIQLLVSRGANLQLKDLNGLTALHIGQKKIRLVSSRLFTHVSFIACHHGHLDIVRWLIDKQQMNIDQRDYMNFTPLHFAAASGKEHVVHYLLENNGQILSSTRGNTPLHVVSRCRSLFDLRQRHVSFQAAENGHRNVCAIFVERGLCSLAAMNHDQLRAADLAHNAGHLSLANELGLRARTSLLTTDIQLEKATVVRLVIKKRNVPRSDASNQVNEQDLIVHGHREESPNESHQSSASRDPRHDPFLQSNGHVKRYAPWLEKTNQTTQQFQEEIQ